MRWSTRPEPPPSASVFAGIRRGSRGAKERRRGGSEHSNVAPAGTSTTSGDASSKVVSTHTGACPGPRARTNSFSPGGPRRSHDPLSSVSPAPSRWAVRELPIQSCSSVPAREAASILPSPGNGRSSSSLVRATAVPFVLRTVTDRATGRRTTIRCGGAPCSVVSNTRTATAARLRPSVRRRASSFRVGRPRPGDTVLVPVRPPGVEPRRRCGDGRSRATGNSGRRRPPKGRRRRRRAPRLRRSNTASGRCARRARPNRRAPRFSRAQPVQVRGDLERFVLRAGRLFQTEAPSLLVQSTRELARSSARSSSTRARAIGAPDSSTTTPATKSSGGTKATWKLDRNLGGARLKHDPVRRDRTHAARRSDLVRAGANRGRGIETAVGVGVRLEVVARVRLPVDYLWLLRRERQRAVRLRRARRVDDPPAEPRPAPHRDLAEVDDGAGRHFRPARRHLDAVGSVDRQEELVGAAGSEAELEAAVLAGRRRLRVGPNDVAVPRDVVAQPLRVSTAPLNETLQSAIAAEVSPSTQRPRTTASATARVSVRAASVFGSATPRVRRPRRRGPGVRLRVEARRRPVDRRATDSGASAPAPVAAPDHPPRDDRGARSPAAPRVRSSSSVSGARPVRVARAAASYPSARPGAPASCDRP